MITGSLKKTQSLPEKANQKKEAIQEKIQPQKDSQASQQSITQNQQQFAISQSLINQQLAAQQQFILASSATGSQQQIALTRPLMVMPQFGPQGAMESGIVLPSAGTSLRPQMPRQYYSGPATLHASPTKDANQCRIFANSTDTTVAPTASSLSTTLAYARHYFSRLWELLGSSQRRRNHSTK